MKKVISTLIAILICLSSVTVSLSAVEAQNGFILKEGENKSISFSISEAAGYSVTVRYIAVKGRNVSPEIALSWDKECTGAENEIYGLPRIWTDVRADGRFKKDDYGNELSPTSVEITKENTVTLMPQDENWSKGFNLTAGEHTLYLSMLQESVDIKSVTVKKIEKTVSYSDYIAAIEQSGKDIAPETDAIYTDAELLHEKSHLEIAVSYDRSSPNVYPNEPNLVSYNLLGGSWSHAGQWVSYEVNVKESGLYKLNFSYRQRAIAGVDVRRKVMVDGAVPFDEFNCVTLPSSNSFTSFIPSNGDDAYYVYLEKGMHEIRFEVVLDSLQDIVNKFSLVLKELNELSSKINVIVGEGVDLNRDYDFKTSIPELAPTLISAADSLDKIVEEAGSGSSKTGSQVARIAEAARLFRSMAKKPNEIANQIDYYRTQLYDLASVLSSMQTQPLELDYFELIPKDGETAVEKKSILTTLGFRMKAFLSSFVGDYSSVNAVNDTEALEVWTSLGRDQAQVINQLVVDDFTTKTGIPVKLSLVTTNIMTAIASNKAPDVVLNLASTNIADLYYRDALIDLSEMENFGTVTERFYPSALKSFTYKGKTYALPMTQSFQMMFYRTDVFEANGFKVPNTWAELYSLLSKMQNGGMSMGISVTDETFYAFLLQSGIEMYNGELSKTNLTDKGAVNAFKSWTELFTKYGIPKSYDGTNRFRTGQMPLVISDYSFYRTLKVSAPEISNSFAMAPIPGTETADGIDRTENSAVTGTVAIKGVSEDYKPALKFIDWATSDSVQEKYSFNSELRVGISARVTTANKKVMDTISWSTSELNALKTQWASVTQMPISPAYYYINRNLSNAFRKVVYQGENPSDVIFRYSSEINAELERKHSQLRLEDK